MIDLARSLNRLYGEEMMGNVRDDFQTEGDVHQTSGSSLLPRKKPVFISSASTGDESWQNSRGCRHVVERDQTPKNRKFFGN